MSWWSSLGLVAFVAVVTYGMRAGVIIALGDRALPARVERALRSVGPAVLAALAVNLAAGGEGETSLALAEAAALAVAVGVAWWRRDLIQTVLAGMLTLWLLSAV